MRYFLTALLILSWVSSAYGQSGTYRVIDRATGDPVIQAHIKSGEESVITTTDTDGYFTLNPEEYPAIIITAVG